MKLVSLMTFAFIMDVRNSLLSFILIIALSNWTLSISWLNRDWISDIWKWYWSEGLLVWLKILVCLVIYELIVAIILVLMSSIIISETVMLMVIILGSMSSTIRKIIIWLALFWYLVSSIFSLTWSSLRVIARILFYYWMSWSTKIGIRSDRGRSILEITLLWISLFWVRSVYIRLEIWSYQVLIWKIFIWVVWILVVSCGIRLLNILFFYIKLAHFLCVWVYLWSTHHHISTINLIMYLKKFIRI